MTSDPRTIPPEPGSVQAYYSDAVSGLFDLTTTAERISIGRNIPFDEAFMECVRCMKCLQEEAMSVARAKVAKARGEAVGQEMDHAA